MRTTLDLPDKTFRQLKSQAAINGLKLKELIKQLIERGLAAGVTATPSPPTQSLGPMVVERIATATARPTTSQPQSYPIPIAREADGSVTPHLSNTQLNAILEDDDLAQYHRVMDGTSSQ